MVGCSSIMTGSSQTIDNFKRASPNWNAPSSNCATTWRHPGAPMLKISHKPRQAQANALRSFRSAGNVREPLGGRQRQTGWGGPRPIPLDGAYRWNLISVTVTRPAPRTAIQCIYGVGDTGSKPRGPSKPAAAVGVGQ